MGMARKPTEQNQGGGGSEFFAPVSSGYARTDHDPSSVIVQGCQGDVVMVDAINDQGLAGSIDLRDEVNLRAFGVDVEPCFISLALKTSCVLG